MSLSKRRKNFEQEGSDSILLMTWQLSEQAGTNLRLQSPGPVRLEAD